MCQQKQQPQMIRDILLIFWRFHRIGFPSRYEAHAILAMLAVSVWHWCWQQPQPAVEVAKMVRPAWCRLDRDLWKVWNIPKMKKESEGQWRWWVSHFFLNLVTKWRWQGVKNPGCQSPWFDFLVQFLSLSKLINIRFCRKRYEMMRIIVLFMFVYAYIFKGHTHTQTHIRVRPQLGRRSPTPSREVINPAFICISTRKWPTFCWWTVNCMAALVINL